MSATQRYLHSELHGFSAYPTANLFRILSLEEYLTGHLNLYLSGAYYHNETRKVRVVADLAIAALCSIV
jgi:hypothetical protein